MRGCLRGDCYSSLAPYPDGIVMNPLYIPILLTALVFGIAFYFTTTASGQAVSPGVFLFGGAVVASVVNWAVYGLMLWAV